MRDTAVIFCLAMLFFVAVGQTPPPQQTAAVSGDPALVMAR